MLSSKVSRNWALKLEKSKWKEIQLYLQTGGNKESTPDCSWKLVMEVSYEEVSDRLLFQPETGIAPNPKTENGSKHAFN